MEFTKMVLTTLYARQQKRPRCKEQTFGLWGRRQGWDDLREQHCNMYITTCEINGHSKFNAWNRALKAGALGQPRGMGWGRWEGVQDVGTRVHPWLIHVDVWPKPPQYCKARNKGTVLLKKRENYILPPKTRTVKEYICFSTDLHLPR